MGFKLSIGGILMLVAGVLAAVGVFLAWLSYGGISFTGWQIFDLGSAFGSEDFRAYLPLVSLILGVVAILIVFLNAAGIFEGGLTRIIVLVLGVLILLMPFLTFSESLGDAMKYMGIGWILEIVAGILLILTPLLVMLKVLPEE